MRSNVDVNRTLKEEVIFSQKWQILFHNYKTNNSHFSISTLSIRHLKSICGSNLPLDCLCKDIEFIQHSVSIIKVIDNSHHSTNFCESNSAGRKFRFECAYNDHKVQFHVTLPIAIQAHYSEVSQPPAHNNNVELGHL